MSAKAVNEFCGKELLYRHLDKLNFLVKPRAVHIGGNEDFNAKTCHVEWLQNNQV